MQGLRTHGHRQVVALDSPEKLAGCTSMAHPGDYVACLGAGTSRNGPTRCPANLQRWRAAERSGSDARFPIMTFPDLVADLRARMPDLRGRLFANQSLAELTWFRVGGPAQVLFMPEDESDLAYFLANLPADIAVTVIGLGSNLIVRDGGVPGVVIRLGRGFSEIAIEGHNVRAGTAVPDVKVARAAQEAGIAGLAFMRGIPGRRRRACA